MNIRQKRSKGLSNGTDFAIKPVLISRNYPTLDFLTRFTWVLSLIPLLCLIPFMPPPCILPLFQRNIRIQPTNCSYLVLKHGIRPTKILLWSSYMLSHIVHRMYPSIKCTVWLNMPYSRTHTKSARLWYHTHVVSKTIILLSQVSVPTINFFTHFMIKMCLTDFWHHRGSNFIKVFFCSFY